MAIYAFDGTWNSAKEQDEQHQNTNVFRFFSAYTKNAPPAKPEIKHVYLPGVGTRLRAIGGGIAGGVWGAGELPRLNEAYDQLCVNWAAGDHVIDIIGFSRGAATTLDFCHIIQTRQIRKPGSDTIVDPNPTINFLGVWDIVAAFGLANLGLTDLNIGHHLSLPKDSVRFAFHAMAIDERRPSFLPTRIEGAYEVWFRGVHADVGGGNGNLKLNDIALKWMMSKAKAAQLPITAADINALSPGLARPGFDDLPHRLARLDTRIVRAIDRCHHTIAPMQDCRMPPATCPIETADTEQQAIDIHDLGIVVLPRELQGRMAALAKVAQATAQRAQFPLDGIDDALATLIQARIPLVDTDDKLRAAEQATVQLVTSTIKHAQQHQFHALNEFFLSEALFELQPLFPYTD
jgi:hypothetical protein